MLIKRIISATLIFVFVFGLLPVYSAENPIRVTFNGNYIEFDQPPVAINGRVLVPVRKIFEAMGATVDYDWKTKQVTGKQGDLVITLKIDSNLAYVNGKKITLDVPAKAINGRTLVPARFIAESLGAQVNWNGTNRTVEITKFFVDYDDIPGIANVLSPSDPGVKIMKTNVDKEIVYGNYDLYMKIPANTLNGASTLTIVPYKVEGFDENIIKPLSAYDVSIAEQSSFNKNLTIEIPYSLNQLDMKTTERIQLIAAYFNEDDKKWHSIPYEVDMYNLVVRISTNHLTRFMVGTIKDKNRMNTFSEKFSNKMAAVQDLLNAAYTAVSSAAATASEGASSVATAVSDFVDTSLFEVKTFIRDWKVVIDDFFAKDVVSVYKTEHFHILYSARIEKEMNDKGYVYTDRQYKDTDYPKIEWGKNFVEIEEGTEISIDKLAKRYPNITNLNEIVPVRIKELGIFLEEAYRNYSKTFRNINTPYTVYVARGGAPRDNKFSNSMYLPIEYLNDSREAKATLAHEMFHAFQRKYANLVDMTKNNWLMEVTAEYAAHKLAYLPTLEFNGFRTTNMNYFQRPLGTVEALLWTRGEHEYRSAKFIEYLINKHGLDVKEMLENYSSEYFANNFGFLEKYLKGKNSDFILGKAYLDFAGYMMMDSAGDVKTSDMYEEAYYKLSYDGSKQNFDISLWQDRAYIPWLAASKIDIPEKQKRKVLVTAESPELGLGVNVYLLKGNIKTAGIKPLLELSKELKKSMVVEVEKGDVIYILAGNSAIDDPYARNHTMKGKVTIEDAKMELKREYSNITRTTKTVKLTPEGSGLEDLSKLDIKWTVTSNKGNYVDLNDPRVATFHGASMTVNLIHENPVEEMDSGPITGSTNPFGSGDPFGIVIVNIDDGTEYTITLKIINKETNSEIYSTTIKEIVGMKSPIKDDDSYTNPSEISEPAIRLD